MGASVTATRAALELIEGLTARSGPLAFHQSGRCCDGSAPMCLRRGELPPGRYDIQLGELAGAPFYVDFDLYRRWGSPQLVIDVSASAGDGFSLEGSPGRALRGAHQAVGVNERLRIAREVPRVLRGGGAYRPERRGKGVGLAGR